MIRVGWADYRVEIWDHVTGASKQRYGECSTVGCTIRLDTKFGNRQTAKTLLHEVMHAACDVFNCDFTNREDLEEYAVSALSNAMASVWRDNPVLVRFLDHAFSR